MQNRFTVFTHLCSYTTKSKEPFQYHRCHRFHVQQVSFVEPCRYGEWVVEHEPRKGPLNVSRKKAGNNSLCYNSITIISMTMLKFKE